VTRQQTHWYRDLVDRLASRAVRSYLSLLSPANPAFRAELTRRLDVQPGRDDSVMASPVFEARFGYPSADRTMGELAADGLLHPDTVAWMDQPPPELREQRFPVERRPYVHQLRSWETLGADEVRSLVVATGTGSGKTECFTVPLLDALAREAEGADEPLEGIQAIFLYPLNALINSQRERLSAWTRGAGGRLRYCLYNGETPKREQPAPQRRLTPERVLSRPALRRSPPPLLVTNATMLEYMLVRPEDREIIEKSRGRLRWIVLDEAHTYLGSNAAELTLLIRRVLEAFEVDPSEVRFVATSATISSGSQAESRRQLAAFLGAISGQPPENVEVVTAAQEIPPLPPEGEPVQASIDELTGLEPRPRYDAMCREPRARRLRSQVVSGAKTIQELGRSLGGLADEEVLALLDLGREARAPDGEPFLPLRAHLFLRTQPGVWVCSNPQCAGRAGTLLDDEQWQFGAIYTHEERVCAHCDSRVYELALCSQCGGEYLEGSYMTMGDHFVFARSDRWSGGLPTVDADHDGIVPEGDDHDEEEGEDAAAVQRTAFLGVHPPLDPDAAERFDPATGRLGADGYPVELVGTIEGERQRCVRCGETERGRGALFRAARSGGEFVLGTAIPALMESMPEAEQAPGDKPFRGRRTLTFTDSRQGTARFAARAQGEAERVTVRGFLYHQVWAMCGGGGAPDLAEQEELEQLRANLATTTIPVVRTALEARIAELEARAGGPASVPLSQLVARLAEESPDLRWIHDRRRAYGPFQLNRHQLAQLLVTREIARRPRRRSSLETLGLLRLEYPTLSESLTSAPRAWRTLGGTLDEWKDFVRLTLDFVVRSNSALQIPREFFRWMGTEIRTLDIVGPEEEAGRQRRRWPRWRGGQVPRLARLLVRAFELSPNAADTWDMINDVLDQSWRVVRAGLARTQVGWRFDLLERGALAPTEHVWRCPVTRTALSTTLRGHTPFQPPLGGLSRIDTRCASVRMPEPLAVFGRTRDDAGRPVAAEEIDHWLEAAPVSAVRRQGLWSEFTDRIVSEQRWFAVGEHSAQLSSEQLQRREKAFKEEKLNVLSCSTTMEMGVDIGRLSSVSMNNAPPGPANFLQRAGRAGRRDETAAVSLTVCRSRPHDEEVFTNPTWPLRTPIHVTEVRLDSQAIVQRHVNAFLLGRFLARAAGGEQIHRLNCAWFLVGQPDEEAPVDLFVAELESLEDGAEVDEPVERLLRGSAFEVSDQAPVRDRVRQARHAVVALWEAFQRERDALVAERELIPEREREDSPAARAIKLQLMRIDREYLLSFMASRQFLPGYGFPTGVVPFVTTTAEELRVATRRGHARIDNRALMRGYPSRDLAAALREYAPGSDVVLDGRVYRSRGVTLNWHRPPEPGEAAPAELQAFKVVWRCGACGSGGSGTAWPVTCPDCASDRVRRHQYLEPAGFAVDLFKEAETDMSSRTWIPPEEPWIFAGSGDMEALGDPVRLRYRYSPHGEIVHLSGGEHGRGYSICLSCGRSASQVEQDVVPPDLEGHRRLRGGGAPGQRDEDGRCEGSADERLIRRNQWLGTAGLTDVLELHLLDSGSGRPLRDRTVAVTLGVAIRNALAGAIGVETEEIGVAVQPGVGADGRCLAIVLYDRASGGAGFCGQAPALLPRVLRDARAALQCPRECRTACHACLLDFYTQNQRSLLDRRAGLEFLTIRWLEAVGEVD
jgi:DEAD/DEAH box helicase domain-containing protein